MTLTLQFPGWAPDVKSRFDPGPVCALQVIQVPDGADPRAAEAVARCVIDAGLMAPVDFRVLWPELVRRGLEAGLLCYPGGRPGPGPRWGRGMTLRLVFGAARYPGVDAETAARLPGAGGSTIFVTGAPDDPEWAEYIARSVMEAGVGPVPRMGRIAWDELVSAGLEAGILERRKED